MRAFVILLVLATAPPLIVGCGATPGSPDARSSRVILYRNGVGYFERDTLVTGGELSLAVRNHELDDVLTTLAIVGDGDGAELVPIAELPAPPNGEGNADAVHHLRFAVGEGPRRVRVAWATQTPAWRVSYRLVLPGAEEGQRGHLSGWAVVDNTTAEDWEGVQLTLATAEPLSFAVDLRTPRYVDRPDVTGYVAPRIAAGPVFAESFVGYEVDRDADGILDEDDLCPDDSEQFNGFSDDDGCPDRAAVLIESNALQVLQAVFFEPGSTQIRGESEAVLAAVAQTLMANAEVNAEVHGHADAGETSPYRLAAERAGAVREALIARGVDGARLSVRGFGATQPIDTGRTAAARARNRRVSFVPERDQESSTSGGREGIVASAMSRGTRGAALSHTGIGGTRYEISRAVDIEAGRSALIAAVSVDVDAEELYLFRPDGAVPDSAQHPFRAARVDNATDVDLVPGPVALYGHGRLLGQGMLAGLRAGEDVIIPWALDDGTHVEPDFSYAETPALLVSVSRSRAVLRRRVTRTSTYTVRVGRHAPERILIRHVVDAGAELLAPPPGTERGRGFALVPLPITSGATSVLTLSEERFVDEAVDLATEIGIDIGPYVQATPMAEAERERFDEIRADRRALRQGVARGRELLRGLSEHGMRTAELRAALEALPAGAGVAAVRTRLARQLVRAVADGEALSAELASLRAAEVDAKGRLRGVSAGFSWPASPAEGEVASADSAP